MHTLLSRRRDERGAVIVLAAVGMVLAMISAALAVDLGTLAQDARRNQKVADLAALDAARVLPAGYDAAAKESAARNGFDSSNVTGIEGIKVDGECQPQAGAGTVCVTVTSPHKNNFPFVVGPGTVSRAAMAGAGGAIGTVRVGSNVASAGGSLPSPMGVKLLDETISSLIGGNVSATAVGWQGLASGNVTFAALTSALAGVTGNGTFNAGTADEVLSSTFTAAQLFTATANALNNSGNAADISIANQVQQIGLAANGTALSAPLKLYDFFDFGGVYVGNKEDVANATLNVLDLIRGGAILADGDRFATFTLDAADIIGGTIPGGFNKVKVSMGLVQAPQQASGPAGMDAGGVHYTSAHTSQIRVRLDVMLRVPLTQAITGVLGVVLLPAGTLLDATYTYYLEGGTGHAYLDTLNCGSTTDPTSVEILGKTDVTKSWLGTVNDTNLKNTLIVPVPTSETILSIAGLLNVTTNAAVKTEIPGNPGTMLTFTPPYTASSPPQPVPGSMLSLPSLATTNVTVNPLVAVVTSPSLVSDLVSGINSTGLTFNSSTVGLNTSVLKPLYDALGLSFGGADVWAPPAQTCSALSDLGAAISSDSPPVLKG